MGNTRAGVDPVGPQIRLGILALRMSNATSLLLLEEESMLDEGVPWYRQVELIVTLVLAVVLVAGVIWHLMNLSEWAEESLQYVEMAAMETAQYAQQDRGEKDSSSSPKSRSPRRGSPRGISSPELMSSTNSRVAVGAKAVAGAGKDTVLFAPRALVSAGISIKYRLHNVIDDVVQTAESLSPRWRAIWAFGNIIILGLALTVLMFIPGSFLLLFLAWTAFCSARGGDTDASAIDLITDMVASTDMAAVSHLDGVEHTKKSFVNPLLSSRDLEDGELQSASKNDGGNLLGPAAADGDVLFVGQKSGKVTRDEARALHTMLRMQQEQYAKQREAQERAERKREALKLFDEIDVDGNGTLDVEELTELAKSMGVELTPKQAELAFADLDTDASGEIDFDEFFTFYEANVGGHGGLRGGFNSFFGGFKLRLQTVGLNASKHQISHDPNANAISRGPNMKLASLKPGGGGGAGGGGSSSADARARTRAIDNVRTVTFLSNDMHPRRLSLRRHHTYLDFCPLQRFLTDRPTDRPTD